MSMLFKLDRFSSHPLIKIKKHIFSLFWKKPKNLPGFCALCTLLQNFLEVGLPVLHMQAILSNDFFEVLLLHCQFWKKAVKIMMFFQDEGFDI